LFDFIQLIRNENMKIYRRPRTWVMLGILLVLTLAPSVLMMTLPDAGPDSMWSAFPVGMAIGFFLVTIYSVVVAAETVAGEFSTGTIKLLMIRPWSRSKILLSKYVSVVLFSLLFLLILFVWNYLTTWLMFGGDPTYRVGADNRSPLSYYMLQSVYKYISLLMVVTLSFLISTVFRSGSFAIGLAMFMLFAGQGISSLFMMLGQKWAKYLLFLHMDVSRYLDESVIRIGELGEFTLSFSLTVLAVYYVVFIALTWYIFNKRDIAT